MNFRIRFHLFLILLVWQQVIQASDILIITNNHSPVTQLSVKELRKIYTKEIQIDPNGSKWIPVNVSSNHAERVAFSLRLFDKRPEEMELYWNNQYFKGITPPYVVDSPEAMESFVANTPGAIGYIFSCHPSLSSEQFKIIARLPYKASYKNPAVKCKRKKINDPN